MLFMLRQSYNITVVSHFLRDKGKDVKPEDPCLCCNTLFLSAKHFGPFLFLAAGLNVSHSHDKIHVLTTSDESACETVSG